MTLSSLNLEAFQAVAQAGSFSAASKLLGLTQSALSQRVLNLEQDIGTALFIREPKGIMLTEAGSKLLRYCLLKLGLEQEFRSDIFAADRTGGIIKVSAYSTIAKSLVLPALSSIVKENPAIQLFLKSKEIRQLPLSLFSGESEFILLPGPLEKQGMENHLLGYENNVLIRSSLQNSIKDVYLDHDEHDATTYDFLRQQSIKFSTLRRSYLDDIDCIIEGVKLGLGWAVVPQHLLGGIKGIEVVKSMKPLKVPVYLVHYSQSYYTKLQLRVRAELIGWFKKEL